jgi:AcrR family transcriptional regulator
MTVDEGAMGWTPRSLSPAIVDEGKPEGVYARRTRIRKQEILDSALVAFGQKGFYKATLADVASAAGITAAGLLHHFKTKEALLVELLHQRDLVGLEGSADGALPRGRALLQHLVDTMADNMTKPVSTQVYAVLSAEGVTDAHPARHWFLDRYQRLRQVVAAALIDGASDGDIEAPDDVEATASSGWRTGPMFRMAGGCALRSMPSSTWADLSMTASLTSEGLIGTHLLVLTM